MFAHKKQDATL